MTQNTIIKNFSKHFAKTSILLQIQYKKTLKMRF